LLPAQQRLTQRIHKLAHKKAKNKVCKAADLSSAESALGSPGMKLGNFALHPPLASHVMNEWPIVLVLRMSPEERLIP